MHRLLGGVVVAFACIAGCGIGTGRVHMNDRPFHQWTEKYRLSGGGGGCVLGGMSSCRAPDQSIVSCTCDLYQAAPPPAATASYPGGYGNPSASSTGAGGAAGTPEDPYVIE